MTETETKETVEQTVKKEETAIEGFVKIMREFGAKIAEDTRKDLITEIQKVREEAIDDAKTAIREGLGLTKEKISWTTGEIEGLVRKILLEETGDQKRSETIIKDKPIETDEPPKIKRAAEMFEELNKNRGVV